MRKRFTFHILNSLLLGGILLGVLGCKDPDGPETKTFDQNALLSNLANNLIVPNYEDLQSQINQLESIGNDFTANPSIADLEALQTELKETWKAWLHCSSFELGPAADHTLRASLNTFPADTGRINNNILSGSFNLQTAANLDAKGLPGLDYLLNGLAETNSDIVAEFQDPMLGQGRLDYLNELISDVKSQLALVLDAWHNGYTNTFIQAQGTDVGSSLGKLVNDFNFDLEILKKPRLGIPLGVTTLNIPIPENVEALYGGYSVELIVEHFEAIQDVYYGRSMAGVDGYGLYEALEGLEASYNNGSLAEAIDAQIKIAEPALAAIPSPLSETVVNNPALAEAAYLELQKLLVLFKTDMPSAFGILITYQDNDGD